MDPVQLMRRFAAQPPSGGEARPAARLVIEPLPHRRYREAIRRIAEHHHDRQVSGTGRGFLITGPSGVGKSTVLQTYAGSFPRQQDVHGTRIPVLLVKVPSSPTTKSLAGAILHALGQKMAHRGTAPEKTTVILQLFERCGVEVVLFDEFQHLFYPPTVAAFRDLTDWLKNFVDDTRAAVVGCGLQESELVVGSNEQLARRFLDRVRFTRFVLGDEEDFREFRGVLRELQKAMPMHCAEPLYEANLARRLHVASYGLIDYLIRILERAIWVAVEAGLDQIDLPVLAEAFRTRVWREVPERLNPFHPQSPLRPLDRPGEAFHPYARREPVGSPVARKLGMNLSRGGWHAGTS